jgi:hypothetical protein
LSIGSFIKFLFFGNYFYGICAVALSVEALLQQGFPVTHPLYFVVVFTGSVIYYTIAYLSDGSAATTNPRTIWYRLHHRTVIFSQWTMGIIGFCCSLLIAADNLNALAAVSPVKWFLILIFPATAILYYGLNTRLGRYDIRSIGWLKPFTIGFIWAGVVTVYPVLLYDILNPGDYALNWISIFLFVKNFMFISVLCIMFDIKDYAMDYNAQLKTFVVKVGLRRTIFQIIIPLSVIGLASFLIYAVLRDFSIPKIQLNIIPFILLIVVAYSLHTRRSVLYYLIIIDGLMLVKAICGSLATLFF